MIMDEKEIIRRWQQRCEAAEEYVKALENLLLSAEVPMNEALIVAEKKFKWIDYKNLID